MCDQAILSIKKSFRNWIFRRKHLKTRYRRRLRRGSFIVRKSRATINSPPFPCRMAISMGDNSCFRLYISFDDLKMGFADFCILVNHTNSLSIRRISETRHHACLKLRKNLYGSANYDLLAFLRAGRHNRPKRTAPSQIVLIPNGCAVICRRITATADCDVCMR